MTMSKNKKLSNLTYCRADIGGEKIQVQAAGALVSDKKKVRGWKILCHSIKSINVAFRMCTTIWKTLK